jgi:type IX secretion system PorP/SprF family membrane protein
MKVIKRFIILVSLILLFLQNCICQDPTFSQFYANPLYLAPSFAGAIEGNRFSLNYRDQWPAIPGVFNTYSFSFDKALPNFNSGIGILATYDVAGSGNLSTTNIGVLYSYDFNINKQWHIRPGVEFKFYYLGLDINKLIFNSQVSGAGNVPVVLPPQFNNIAGVDFTSSAVAYNDNAWGGFTLDHMFKPKLSFYGDNATVPIKISLFGGWQIFKKTRLRQSDQDIVSIAMILQKQGKFYQSDVGVYYYVHPLVFGIWYRGIPFIKVPYTTWQAGDAIIGLVGIKTKQFKFGYSYDFTVSSLYNSTKGAHEISLIYEFNALHLLKKMQRIKSIPCPDF